MNDNPRVKVLVLALALAGLPAQVAAADNEPITVTPADQLKKNSLADLKAAAKLAKEGEAWTAAFAKLKKRVGPPNFWIEGGVTAYYWSVARPEGGCDQLFATQYANKLDGIGTRVTAKGEQAATRQGRRDMCTGGAP
jgi:hypothetical protein